MSEIKIMQKKIYFDMISKVMRFSEERQIPLFFIGVVSRPGSKTENYFSKRLNRSANVFVCNQGFPYIEIFGTYTENNEYKFMSDKLHLNSIGHKEISMKMMKETEKILIERLNNSM